MGQHLFSATVISGVGPALEQPLFRFAASLFDTKGVDLILRPDTEAALGKLPKAFTDYSRQERYQLRELLEARARLSAENGSWRCLIVANYACRSVRLDWEESKRLVRQECRIVRRWGAFRQIRIACATPEGGILSVDPVGRKE